MKTTTSLKPHPPSSAMAKTIWHSGPPPEIGWWPASISGSPERIRWWDGKCWSVSITPQTSAVTAGKMAKQHSVLTGISWTDRWWLNPTGEKYEQTEN